MNYAENSGGPLRAAEKHSCLRIRTSPSGSTGFAIVVYRELGSGLLESVCETCLAFELKGAGIPFRPGRAAAEFSMRFA